MPRHPALTQNECLRPGVQPNVTLGMQGDVRECCLRSASSHVPIGVDDILARCHRRTKPCSRGCKLHASRGGVAARRNEALESISHSLFIYLRDLLPYKSFRVLRDPLSSSPPLVFHSLTGTWLAIYIVYTGTQGTVFHTVRYGTVSDNYILYHLVVWCTRGIYWSTCMVPYNHVYE